MEMESGNSPPFLDTILTRQSDGSLDVAIYRKPTHTDRYLNFSSNHPAHVKQGLAAGLFRRARTIAQGQNISEEENHVCEVLRANGYPEHLIFFINEAKKEERSWGETRTYYCSSLRIQLEWGPEKNLLETWNSDSIHYLYHSPPATYQGQRHGLPPKKIWGSSSNSMQLRIGIHWGDKESTSNPSERTQDSHLTGKGGQIGFSRTCLEPPTSTSAGWDIHPGSSQQQTCSAHQRSHAHRVGDSTRIG